MNKKIIVSAPGKLMLFGEHSVIFGHPCIVTAVEKRMRATVEIIEEQEFILTAPDVSIKDYRKPMSELGTGKIPSGSIFVETAIQNITRKMSNKKFGIKVTTDSEFSPLFGFGSSSAVTVCTVFALNELFRQGLSRKEIFGAANKTVLDIQGKGSGFDVAAAVFGGTFYFVSGQAIEPISIDKIPFLVGYSDMKSDTVKMIKQVAKKVKKYPDISNGIFAQIDAIVVRAKKALHVKDWKTVGELMDLNAGCLEALGVGSGKLSAMIFAARDSGAYGAKLSGAGGGDCMIALVSPGKRKAVIKAIKLAGGKYIDVEINAEGVRIETK